MTKKRIAFSAAAALFLSSAALTPALAQNLEDSTALDEILRRPGGSIGPAGSFGSEASGNGDSENGAFGVAQASTTDTGAPPNSDEAPPASGGGDEGDGDEGGGDDEGGDGQGNGKGDGGVGTGNGNGQGNGNGNGNGGGNGNGRN